MVDTPELGVIYSIKSVYSIVKIFGLAPVTFNKSTPPYWKVQYKSLIYSFIVILFTLLSLYPLFLYQKLQYLSLSDDLLSMYSDCFRALSFFSMTVLMSVTSVLNCEELCQLLIGFISFDRNLLMIGVNIDYLKTNKKVYYTNIIFFICLLTFVLLDFYFFIYSNSHFQYPVILYWVVYVFLFYYNMVAFSYILCFIYLIYQRFIAINNHILDLHLTHTQRRKEHSETSLYFIRDLSDNYNSHKIIQKIPVVSESVCFQNEIYFLSRIYDEICCLSNKINKLFSLQVLLVTGSTFVVLVAGCYLLYLMISTNQKYEFSFSKVWTSVAWGILFSFVLFIVTYGCSKMKDEGERMQMLLNNIPLGCIDCVTKINIEMISLQMVHQKVNFTAWGFFSVDITALYMVMGAVTTYLIFLIQFEMASRPTTT